MQMLVPGMGSLKSTLTNACVVLLITTHAVVGLELENSFCRIMVDAEKGTFTAYSLASGKEFLTDGKLTAQGGVATKFETTEKGFGTGQSIEFRYSQREPGLHHAVSQAAFHFFSNDVA